MNAIKKMYKIWRDRWGKVPTALTLTAVMLLSVVLMAIAAEFVVTPADPNHLINGAWFMQFLPEDATGTGLFNPFVRVSANSEVVQGYNTDYRPVQFQESGGQWTDSIPLSDIPYFLYEGVLYREFQLDINQTNNSPLISLDEVQIWLGGAGADLITGFVPETVETDFGTFPGFALQEVYNLDADQDNFLTLDYSNAAGSGKRDLKLLVPDDYFKPYDEACEYMGTGCEQYVVFFTQFGINSPNNDGFEEWGVAIYNNVSGFKWHDLDADGIWDEGEPGLEDWTICAEDIDSGEIICTTTDENGKYIIPLPDGDYSIYEECPETLNPWYQSFPTPDGGVCGTGVHLVSLSATGQGPDIESEKNFGNYQGIPDIEIDKTGDLLSKIGDDVDYTITVDNTSTEGTADLYCNITDPMLGIDEFVTLAWDDPDYVIEETFTVPEDATDPMLNTASVICTFVGDDTEQASDTDDHSVNLFQPDFMIEKTGDDLSKIGDTVTYTYTITNMSSEDSPVLDLNSLVDDKIGDLTQETGFDSACDVLSFEEVCSFDIDWEIPESAADPYENRVDAQYQVRDFPNTYDEFATHSVNLFQPAIQLTKEGPDYSKVGDIATYTVTIENMSSEDTPDLILADFSDTLVTDLDETDLPEACQTLVFEESCSFTYDHLIVEADDSGEVGAILANTAYALYNPTGFPNDIDDSDTWEITLLHPSFTITKEGDEYSKYDSLATVPFGDVIDYNLTLENTGDVQLVGGVLEDSLEPSVVLSEECATLDVGETCVLEYSHTVTEAEGALDELYNEATVTYVLPEIYELDNIIEESDDWTTTLIHPGFTLTKECVSEPVKAGEAASFAVDFVNTGDVDLVAEFDEDLTGEGCPLAGVPVTIGVGETLSCTVSIMADEEPGPSVVSNEVNVMVSLPEMFGLDNSWSDMASDTCEIYAVKMGRKWHDMDANSVWDEGEPVLSGWTIQAFEWVSGAYEMTPAASVLTNAEGYYTFDMVKPDTTYAICEVLEAGFMQTFPNVTLPAEGYVDCTQFGSEYGPVGYEIMLASGEYEFDNDFGNFKPLGCTYTQGYWKTHSMYGPAGPYDPTWALKDGGDAPFLDGDWMVGLTWYEMFNTPPAGGNAYIILAHQYMAAWLSINNVDPLKAANPAVLDSTMADAYALLSSYIPEDDLTPEVREEFIMLAELLDDFNNGLLGVPHCEE